MEKIKSIKISHSCFWFAQKILAPQELQKTKDTKIRKWKKWQHPQKNIQRDYSSSNPKKNNVKKPLTAKFR